MVRKAMRNAAAVAAVAVLFGGCGLKRHKYDNPITKDTQQPDKVLFDSKLAPALGMFSGKRHGYIVFTNL
jgi:hypothetical protein